MTTTPDLIAALRQAKEAAAETNASLAEKSGVPLSTVAKILSGSVASPTFEQVAALAAVLGLSLDALAGNPPPESAAVAQAQLQGLRQQLALLRERIQLYERGVRQRNIIICGLLGLTVFFTLAFVAYVVLDLNNLQYGFIRAAQPVSGAIYLGILLALALLLGIGHRIGARYLKK